MADTTTAGAGEGGATTTAGALESTSGADAGGASTGGAGATKVTTETATPGAWMAGMNDDMKGFLGNKGFKGPGDLAESYRNLEKLRGVPEDRLLKLPEQFYDDKGAMTQEGRSIFEKLGVPKDAKEYNLEVPKEHGDQKLTDHFRKVFHEAGIPKAQAEAIVKSWNTYQGEAVTNMKAQAEQRYKDSDAALKKEWGQAFDQNVNIAKDAYRKLGFDAKTVDSLAQVLGHKETMQLMHKLGSSVGEHAFVGGSQSRVMDPKQAVSKIAELRSDRTFAEKLSKGDSEAMSLWTRLHEQAFPGNFDVRA